MRLDVLSLQKRNDIMENSSKCLFNWVVYILVIGCFWPVCAQNIQNTKVFISSDDSNIVYMGRISKRIPHMVRFTYPGVSIIANFEGTSLQMLTSPSVFFLPFLKGAELLSTTMGRDSVREKDSLKVLRIRSRLQAKE